MESWPDFAQMRRELAARRKAFQDSFDEFAAREFTGQDGDGCVWLTVNGLGKVCGVKVDPARLRAMQRDELGRRVVEAVSAARSAATEEAADVFRRLRDAPEPRR